MIMQKLSYVPLFGEVQGCILLQAISKANVFVLNVENAAAPITRNRHHQTSLAIGPIQDHSEKSAKTRRMHVIRRCQSF